MSWLALVLAVACIAPVAGELPIGFSELSKNDLDNWNFDIVCTKQPCRLVPTGASFLQTGAAFVDSPMDLLDREFAGTMRIVSEPMDGDKAPGEQQDHAGKAEVGSTKETLALKRCFALCPNVDAQSNEEPLHSMTRADSLCKKLCITTTAKLTAKIGTERGLPKGEKFEMKPDGQLHSTKGGIPGQTYKGGVIAYPVLDPLCPKVDDRVCNNHGTCSKGKCHCETNYTGEECLPIQAPKVRVTGVAGDAHLTVKDKFTSGYTALPNGFAFAFKVCNGKGKPRLGGYCECDDPVNNGFDAITGKRNCEPLDFQNSGSQASPSDVFAAGSSTVRGNTMLWNCFQPPGCVPMDTQFQCATSCPFCKTKSPSLQGTECGTVESSCKANPGRPPTEPGNGFYQFMRRVFNGQFLDITNMNPLFADGSQAKVKDGAMLLFSPDNINGLGCGEGTDDVCTKHITELRQVADHIQEIYGYPEPFNPEHQPKGYVWGTQILADKHSVPVPTSAQAEAWTADNSAWSKAMFSICEIIIDSPAPMPKTAGKLAGKPRGRATDPYLYDALMRILTYTGKQGAGPSNTIDPPGFNCNGRLKDELLNGKNGMKQTIGPGFRNRLQPSDYSQWETAHFKLMGMCRNGDTACVPGRKWVKPVAKRCKLGLLPSPMSSPPVCCNPNCDACGGSKCGTAKGYDKQWAEANCCPDGIQMGGRICSDEADTSCRMTTSPEGFVPTKTNCGKVPAGLPGQHTRKCCAEGSAFADGKCTSPDGAVCVLWTSSGGSASEELPSC